MYVEYLLLVEKADEFCADAESFNKLLDVDSRLKMGESSLTFENQTKYQYQIQVGDVATKDQRYFHLSFCRDEEPNDSNTDAFASMLAAVRSIAYRLSKNLEVLRDDVSTYYSELSYASIHRIETLMRRLITNFMVVNVGANWIKESVPNPVRKALDGSKRKGWTSNVLDEIDFSVLSQYLLHPYCIGPRDKVLDELPSINTLENLAAFRIRFELRSNWTRYFSEIVDCEEEFLKNRWSELYDLRCKIAHNALIKKQEYERIVRLAHEVEEPLSLAIEKIREIEVPEEELEHVAAEADATQNASQAFLEATAKTATQSAHHFRAGEAVTAMSRAAVDSQMKVFRETDAMRKAAIQAVQAAVTAMPTASQTDALRAVTAIRESVVPVQSKAAEDTVNRSDE